ncbi:alpha-L-fucosidase [Saccharothrix sp.]|uniref:galactose-binding domain-containing protein n=1 Tax=Saccharothrix sp. TaxID=1873460 RepID=UPI002810F7F0|nr:alpha-L-fucosidase [Saccharothrix sp.]
MVSKPIGRRRPRAWRPLITSLGALATFAGAVVATAPTATAAEPNPVVGINSTDTPAQVIQKAASVTPSARQLAWQREELTGFVHFGPNTFTGREWGTGTEDPDVFNPTNLDTDQWMSTFRDAGFKKVILTAKHHDGMLLFPSAYSDHGVASSTWRNGQGDVLRAFTDSARKYGLKVGFYLSPADGHEYQTRATTGRYGNGSTPKPTRIPSIGTGNGQSFTYTVDDYNAYYLNTLYEVLTKYGQVHEVWLDGANPWPWTNQKYNFKDWVAMVRALQPEAVVFQDGGPDVRWAGNEDGLTHRTSEWSPLPYDVDYAGNPADPATAADMVLPVPGGNQALDLGSDARLGQQTNGASSWKVLRWAPAECDGRLQGNYWFWNPDARAVSLDAVKHMYLNSVGKNCQLLLNIAPDNTGRFPADTVSRMKEFGDWIRATRQKVSAGATATNDAGTSNTTGNAPAAVLDSDDTTAWQPTGPTGGLVLDLGSPKTFRLVNLQESLLVGQRVSGFAVDAWNGSGWQQVGTGTTIGYRRLLKLSSAVTTDKVRLRITSSRALPAVSTFSVHPYGALDGNLAVGKPATQSSTLQAGSEADKAVDWDTSGAFGNGSVTHTAAQGTNPWWQVDLGSSQRVGAIRLWNRTDCCSDRLRDFYVFTSDTPFTSNDPQVTKNQSGVWNTYRASTFTGSLTLPVGRSARYVRVQLVGSDRPLSLAEVQVYENMALDQPATQSSTLAAHNPNASRAVDGNTDGNFWNLSVTHTADAPLDTNPWWQVDLGSSLPVGSIKLWNRTDCCADRLRDFYVFTSDTPFTSTDPQVTAGQSGVWKSFHSGVSPTTSTFAVGRSARYVRVQLVGSDRPLSLAEAQVLG